MEAINSREQELGEITQRLFTSQSDSVSVQVAKIRRFVCELSVSLDEGARS